MVSQELMELKFTTGYINEDYESGILIAQDDMNMATFNLDGVSLQAKKINQNFKLVPIKQIVENFWINFLGFPLAQLIRHQNL